MYSEFATIPAGDRKLLSSSVVSPLLLILIMLFSSRFVTKKWDPSPGVIPHGPPRSAAVTCRPLRLIWASVLVWKSGIHRLTSAVCSSLSTYIEWAFLMPNMYCTVALSSMFIS